MELILDLIYFFMALTISFVLYPFWIDFVYMFQMGEDVRADGPASHKVKQGTPTMGGLIFVFTVAVITFVFNPSRNQTLFPVFVASSAGLLGLAEDFAKVYKHSELPGLFEWFNFFKSRRRRKFNLGPLNKISDFFVEFWRVVGSNTDRGLQTYQKFLIQGLLGGFVAYWAHFKLGWDYFWLPLLGDVHVGLLYPIIIFFMFIAILNAVAFTDGLDGLAGGLAVFALMAFWLMSRFLSYNSLAGFCATFVGALIPFLYFNVYPARIFMGNVGSHVLGATMAILGIVLHREIAMLLVIAVFLADGVSSPLQSLSVKLTKKRIFRMAPIHHHFEVLGWPETKVTFRFWIFGIIFAFIGIFVALL